MIVCDLCRNEIKPKDKMPKFLIHTEYACRAWQSVEIDMCEDCLRELQEKINQTEAEFYQKKKHLLE
jgi:hypothetical protein